MQQITYQIDTMHCGGCVSRVEKALDADDGVVARQVNFADRTARVTLAEGTTPRDVAERLKATGYAPDTPQRSYSVPGLNCGSCIARVETAARLVPGVADANANLAERSLMVRYFDLEAEDRLQDALREAGYPTEAAIEEAVEDRPDEIAGLRRATLLAAAMTLPLFVLEMGGHVFPAFHHWLHGLIGRQALWIIQFLLAGLVLAGPGARFHRTGWPALMRGAPDMNALVAVGTGAAFLYSSVATFAPALLPEASRAVYFEAAALIVTLILAGRWMEARARDRTGSAIRALTRLRPDEAIRLRPDGTAETVALSRVEVGDLLELRAGAQVPVDGVVEEGSGDIDESMLTGEPLPVPKAPGDPISAGTLNSGTRLIVRATRVGAETELARIIGMVREAQAMRLPVQDLVNRIAGWFVPAVLVIAGLAALGWILATGDVARAMVASVSVLIVACPCAMGLAVPVSIMVGMGRAARQGILFRDGGALQTLADVRTVAFDKTGTLTVGTPDVLDVRTNDDPGEVLRLAAAVEASSDHPLARAIVTAAGAIGALPTVTELREDAGRGLTAMVDGAEILVGNRQLLEGHKVALPEGSGSVHTEVLVARDGSWFGTIELGDRLRPEAFDAVGTLSRLGVRAVLVSGDRASVVNEVAKSLALDHAASEQSPGDKVGFVSDLPGPTAFIGDGINDAPVLAAADVGIAMGSGTDAAIGAAQVVLMRTDLTTVPAAIRLSRATLRNIRQNLFWAFGYNVALIPVAAGLLVPLGGPMLSPALAAGAMALSSIFVLTNALRLRNA